MKVWQQVLRVFAILLLTVIFNACDGNDSDKTGADNNTGYQAKYVFMFIGDGMGMPQIYSAEDYLGAKSDPNSNVSVKLALSELPVTGVCTTYSTDSIITDSAAAGTALATGYKTNSGIISMDETQTTSYKTIAEIAKDKGMKVGIISSVSIDHATPAVYYAHTPSRNNYEDIDFALLNSSFDYYGGGGMRVNKWNSAERGGLSDAESYQLVEQTATEKGFTYADTRAEFDALTKNSGRTITINPHLDSSNAMPFAVNRLNNNNYDGAITLAEFTKKGIELLENDNGFFIMVEGGKIDWACHANDAAASIKDTLAFDDAVKEALAFYQKHPDETLIIVTADHETGGMTNGFANTGYATNMEVIERQTIAYDDFGGVLSGIIGNTADGITTEAQLNTAIDGMWSNILSQIDTSFGLNQTADDILELTDYDLLRLKDALAFTVKKDVAIAADADHDDYAYYTRYGTYDPFTVTCTHIMNEKAGIGWTTYSHTGVPVPVYAIGAGKDLFDGYYDNTDIFKKLSSVIKAK